MLSNAWLEGNEVLVISEKLEKDARLVPVFACAQTGRLELHGFWYEHAGTIEIPKGCQSQCRLMLSSFAS